MRNRHVLVVAPQPFYEDRGTPIAVRYLLQALSELGYSVDLVAFPVGRHIDIPNVSIYRVANPLGFRSVQIGFSFRKLFLDGLLFWKIRSILRVRKYHYVHAVEEAAIIVACAQGPSHVPVVYDMASSLPEQLAKLPLGNLGIVRTVLDSIERWVINRVDYVICSGGLLPHVRKVTGNKKASEWWFPMIADTFNKEESDTFREEMKIGPNEFLFVYIGSFAEYQGIQIVQDAICRILRQGIQAKFLLVGATPGELEGIRTAFGNFIGTRVWVKERIARENVPKILGTADFLISPRLFGANVPLKIFEYMGTGKPILASDVPAHHTVLDESRAIFFQNTAQDLARAITDLVQNKDKAKCLAESSRNYAKEFLTWPRFRETVKQIAESVQESK